MQCERQIRDLAACAIMLMLAFLSAGAWGQSNDAGAVPSLVEVYWKSSKSVVIPGMTNVTVLDPNIARAETGFGTIQIFFGLERGETVALGYIDGKLVSLRVRVVEKPQVAISPSLLRRQAEMAQGSFGSNVQTAESNGNRSTTAVSSLSWSQPMGPKNRLDFSSSVENDAFTGGHAFNARQGAFFYYTPGFDVHAIDFNVSLTGDGSQRYLSPFSNSDMMSLRGAKFTWRQRNNEYSFYGGTTIPYYYLTLGATRDVGGFSFQRKLTEKFGLFTNTAYINSPVGLFGPSSARRNNEMTTLGLNYTPSKTWSLQAVGGESNHGGMGRGEVAYSGRTMTVFASATTSSPLFPLNQIESIFSGTTAIKTGWNWKSSERLTESFSYQHTITKGTGGTVHDGSSDYLSPAFWFKLSKKNDVNLNYTHSSNSGGFSLDPSTGNRFDINWHSQLSPRISNGVQITKGSLQDPLQLNSQDQFSFRDSIFFPVKGGNMMASFEHNRTNPSLVQKLNAELSVLSPALQTLFLSDPVSFVNSGNLPPEVKALLEAQQPISTSVAVAGQFALGKKLTLNPNFSFARVANGAAESWTPFFGYNLNYRVTPTFQLTSGLNNVWVLSNSVTAQRTTVFTFGFMKYFHAMPLSLVPGHGARVIEGRVFRDSNTNGVFNAGENGLPGIQVQLEDGTTAETNELGIFKFTNVAAGNHRVSLRLAQFPGAIRMTTKSQKEVDLIQQRIAVVNFGVVDFARLMGNVFNDLRFDGKRQQDAKGLSAVRLILDDGKRKRTRAIDTQGTGEFEVDDVPPGDYTLTVDSATLPANYALPADTFQVHIAPISTVVLDIPVRALRSISGRVLLKATTVPSPSVSDPGKLKIGGVLPGPAGSNQHGVKAGQGQAQVAGSAASSNDNTPVPIADIQITAGYGMVKTDEKGYFLLRDLPAGELTITVVPVKPLPPGMTPPSGAVRMPAEPIQIQGATIIISNPDLIPYLVGKTAEEVKQSALRPIPVQNTR